MITITSQAVQHEYTAMHATIGPDLPVGFESDSISLEIPDDGITLEDGWKIVPLFHPVVRKFIVVNQNLS